MSLRQVPEPFITKADVAELLACSETTVDEMRKAGLPSYRWGARMVRFRASESLEWFEKHGRR